MKKKNKKYIITILVLLLFYSLFLIIDNISHQGEKPEITFDKTSIKVSVNDGKEALLKGVKAFDKEDGDLSKEVVVDSISPFDSNKGRIVTYAVFDNDCNVTKESRIIYYTDYVAPRFTLSKTFASNTLNVTNISNMIHAHSCVDGDVSSRISVDAKSSSNSNIINFVAHVSDSTGESSTIELKYNYDTNNYTTQIVLNNYLVYVPQGSTFDVNANIKEINTRSVSYNAMQYMNVQNNIDFNTKGVYEVTYTFNYYGDYGFAKCIVVVE